MSEEKTEETMHPISEQEIDGLAGVLAELPFKAVAGAMSMLVKVRQRAMPAPKKPFAQKGKEKAAKKG